tara:strand:+ start:62 stop:493 length:432 start_codon:yes stop_codon:yes gene_type:complete
MQIKDQLIETYAIEKSIQQQNLWNTSIHLLLLFVALLFTPLSGAMKIVIYVAVTSIVGAIDNHSRNRTAEVLRTNLYLRGLFYLNREKDIEQADQIEMEEHMQLNEKDPSEVFPQHNFTSGAKFILVFTWFISITVLGISASF